MEALGRAFLAAAAIVAAAFPLAGDGAGADRHQVQPRRRAGHAEGQGRRKVQGTCREVHRWQGQGRGLSELAALQGQGGTGGAAARRGADAGAVALQVRAARREGVRGVRPALHLSRLRRAAQGHRRPDRQSSCSTSWKPRASRPGLLGQRLQGHVRQQADQDARRLSGPEDAHPVLEGAGSADAGARARCRR